jgi:choline-sulfatase
MGKKKQFEKKDKPNILILMTDQQRPDSLGCYGKDFGQTPNLDALAEEGVLFENCYGQNPLCCPGRYSLLTGRYPHCHGVRSNWYAPNPGETSFGHRLGRNGYQTSMIGKMHLTPWWDNFGFDGRIIAEAKFHEDCPDDYEAFLNKHGWSRKDLYIRDARYFNQCTAIDSRVPEELHIDSFTGQATCEYLNRIDTSQPFCCIGSFLSPHNPYDPPEPYNKMFRNADFPARNMTKGEVERKPRQAYEYINRALAKDWGTTTDQLSEKQLQLIKANYYALNKLVDDWIGKIIETLKQRGLYDNTIIIYLSDHGDLLGDHGLVFKQCFYEQSVKTPLIVHSPKYFKSAKVTAPVEMIDIFNTVCELAGVNPGYGRQSQSLLPLLTQKTREHSREGAFSENYFGKMIRYDKWKLVYYIGCDEGELYNLEEDPYEQNNRWDDPNADETKSELKEKLLDWVTSTEDSLPLPVRYDHYDRTPVRYVQKHGKAVKAQHQPWHLEGFEDLYQKWEFMV